LNFNRFRNSISLEVTSPLSEKPVSEETYQDVAPTNHLQNAWAQHSLDQMWTLVNVLMSTFVVLLVIGFLVFGVLVFKPRWGPDWLRDYPRKRRVSKRK